MGHLEVKEQKVARQLLHQQNIISHEVRTNASIHKGQNLEEFVGG